MPLICDRAICLRRHEFSETSQVLSLLTERHGLIRVIARGAHRTTKAGASKFDGGLDLLDEGDALFTDRVDKDLNTLAEWKLVDGHRDVRRSQRSLYLGLYVADIVGALFETQEPHPLVFARFRETLNALSTRALEETALAAVLAFASEGGFEPYLAGCVECGDSPLYSRQLWFSAERGGVICRRCERGVPDRVAVDPRAIALAWSLQRLAADPNASLPRLVRRQTDPLHAMLARHLAHNVGRPISMVRWIADPRRGAVVAPARAKVPASVAALETSIEPAAVG